MDIGDLRLPDAEYDESTEKAVPNVSLPHGATPGDVYSYGAPSLPHIFVPPIAPPGTNFRGFILNEVDYSTLPEYQGLGDDAEVREILRLITKGKNHATVDKTNWKYEQRHSFQKVLPFMYLGPFTAARNIEAVKTEEITMLLAVRSDSMAKINLLSGARVAGLLGIEHGAVDVSGNQALIAQYPAAIRIINEHLVRAFRALNPQGATVPENGEPVFRMPKVLVFCESGNERSASLVVAYIMAAYGFDFVSSVQHVQNSRFCISFDDDMKQTLFNFKSVLDAQASVAAHQSPASTTRKRKQWSPDPDAMETDDADDAERFSGRSKFMPYQDSIAE